MSARADVRFKRLVDRFDDKVFFALSLIAALVLLLLFYMPWALNQRPPKPDWEAWVNTQPGAFLQLNVDIPALAKTYRADAIAERVNLAQTYLNAVRPAALQDRRAAYHYAALIACKMASTGIVIPPVLAHLSQDARIKRLVDGQRRLVRMRCSQEVFKPAESEGALLESTPPTVILAWLNDAKTLIDAGCGVCEPGLGSETTAAIGRIEELEKSEAALIENARGYLRSLDDGLDFGFLYSEGYEWILHLTVVSWIGLITASLGLLVVKTAQREPVGMTYLLIVLRFVTAPIIAVVFVATITYGLTDEPVALNHQPLFLIFAFATGYFSESFNLMLRQGLNQLIPSFGIKAERLAGAGDIKAAAKLILHRPKREPAPATNLRELKQNLEASVRDQMAEAEAEAVERTVY